MIADARKLAEEAFEEAAELLDDALYEPCSLAMAARILEALAPIFARHREAGRIAGMEQAAVVLEAYNYVHLRPYIAAIRAAMDQGNG
jgi:hypothetical protein